jgi:hypothetical protein
MLVRGVQLAVRITEAPSLARLVRRRVLPKPGLENDVEALRDYVRSISKTVFHPSARMCADPMAVVSEDVRVRGVEGLRFHHAAPRVGEYQRAYDDDRRAGCALHSGQGGRRVAIHRAKKSDAALAMERGRSFKAIEDEQTMAKSLFMLRKSIPVLACAADPHAFPIAGKGDLRHAACLRVLGFAFLSREALSKAGRAPGPGWT